MSIKNRKRLNNDINLLEFAFVPFLENTYLYDQIEKKRIEIQMLFMKLKNLNKRPLAIIHYLADFFTIVLFISNYRRNVRNYYLIVTTITSLFDVSKELLNNIVGMEEAVDEYEEFNSYFKTIPNDDHCRYASKIQFPLEMELNIPLYDNYRVSGKIQICEKDSIFITGASGVGKSTLAKKLAGYDYHEENDVIYRKCIYYLTQDYGETWSNSNYRWVDLFPTMLTMDEIRRYLSYFAFPMKKITGDDILAEIPALSGGEKKRMQYAYLFYRDLKDEHQIIILDEPHKDLDEGTALAMIDGIRHLYPGKILMIIKHEKPTTAVFNEWRQFHLDDGIIQMK